MSLSIGGCGSEPSADDPDVTLAAAFPHATIDAASDSALWRMQRPGLAVNLVVAAGGDSIAPPLVLLLRGEGDGLEIGLPLLGTYPVSGIVDEAKILVTATNARWTAFATGGTVTLTALDGDELRGRFGLVLSRRAGGVAIPDLPVTGTFIARRTFDLP
jgi:hypothetical protein